MAGFAGLGVWPRNRRFSKPALVEIIVKTIRVTPRRERDRTKLSGRNYLEFFHLLFADGRGGSGQFSLFLRFHGLLKKLNRKRDASKFAICSKCASLSRCEAARRIGSKVQSRRRSRFDRYFAPTLTTLLPLCPPLHPLRCCAVSPTSLLLSRRSLSTRRLISTIQLLYCRRPRPRLRSISIKLITNYYRLKTSRISPDPPPLFN